MTKASGVGKTSEQPGVRIIDSMLDPVDDGIERWLNDRLEHARSVGIRAGFTSLLGVRAIERGLRSVLDRGGRVSVVLGGREQQTESAALAFLLAIAREYSPEQVSLVMVSADAPMQNAKTYYVEDETGHVEAYVGSSNLTNGGLFSNTEAGVVFAGETSEAFAERVREAHRAWESHPSAMKITANVVVDYLRADDGRPSATPEPFHLPRLFADGLEATLDVLELVSASGGQPAGVPTGFTDLDLLTGGLRPGTLTVVGARPAIGKSTLLLDLCRSAAIRNGLTSIFFSLEMSETELNMRAVSAEARVALHHMRSGTMTDDDWARVSKRMEHIAGAPLFFDCSSTLTVDQIADRAARIAARHSLGLMAVDYLQLLTTARRAESRENEVGEQARALKRLARSLNVPIVVAAQLNRGPEARFDKRPMLADLRESDVICQVADIVILLHREDAYERESPRAGEADFIVAKHRNGPTATITTAFQGHYSRFVDMAQ